MAARAEEDFGAHRRLQQANKSPASHTTVAWSTGVNGTNVFIVKTPSVWNGLGSVVEHPSTR